MPTSTPASATAELPLGPLAAGEERGIGRRVRLRRFLRNPMGVVGLALTAVVVLTAVFADAVAPFDPFSFEGRPFESPSGDHLMGTDNFGRDVFSGVVHGARTSMIVAAAVVAIALVIGVAIGAVAGMRGGLVDDVLMRVTELVQAVPRFFVAVLVAALYGPSLTNVVAVLGLMSWPMLTRVVRAEVLSIRERDYVEASRSLGASELRLLVRHVLPETLPATVVVASLSASAVILVEASLAFIGLSDPNVMSWGRLVSNAQDYLRVAWWMSVFPGAAIVIAVLGINLLADALNDLLNPLSSGRERLELAPRSRRFRRDRGASSDARAPR